jgi:hypothetical protein
VAPIDSPTVYRGAAGTRNLQQAPCQTQRAEFNDAGGTDTPPQRRIGVERSEISTRKKRVA